MPFEVDGFGNHLLMDDANVPSLIALPYLGDVDINDPIYQNTRRFVWSEDNPYFFKGNGRRRHWRSAHRLRHDLADEHHDESLHKPER